MATVMRKYYPYAQVIEQLKTDLESLWEWAAIDLDSENYAYLWLDSAKTYGLCIVWGYGEGIGIRKGTTNYHLSNNARDGITVQFEKTTNALILSTAPGDVNISATNCDKYIICNGLNSATKAVEPVVIYLGSKASSNQQMLLAADVDIPVNLSAQNANANTSAKTTNLIPFYSPSSACITTDVFVSLCENINTWYFGNVVINGYTYRMSGSVFARDI